MLNFLKKFISIGLALLLVSGSLQACGNTEPQPTQPTTEPVVTQPAGEEKILKVLTLGHSLTVDCGHMLALIAAAEGYEHLKVGTLYYSGCPLNKHVKFLQSDSPEYALYISSTENPNVPPEITTDVTMGYALRYDYWDIIVMQGGVFEIAEDETYKAGFIQTIQDYVNRNKLNPNAPFYWHMPWATPVDDELRAKYPFEPNSYFTSYADYGHNRTNFYNALTKCVSDNIMTDPTFTGLIPSGTAIENALSSYLEEKDLHRDYAHASDFGRVIASYTWFCVLTGVEELKEIKLDAIPKNFFKSIQASEDRVLTEAEKALILESVNNALKNPLQMTQSQYTEAPAQ